MMSPTASDVEHSGICTPAKNHPRRRLCAFAEDYTAAWCSMDTGNAVRVDGFESWTIDEAGLIVASIGSYDAEEYARQLAEGV